MWNVFKITWPRMLGLLTGLLIIKVTATIVLGYTNYVPPNFESEFLHGRKEYFFGFYQWVFYPHLVAGPVSLLAGLVLISHQYWRRFPWWHRYLGRIQVASVLLVVAPSGLWMAFYAATGWIAGIAFTIQALLTGLSAAIGWRCALKRRFAEHRRWMWRCFLLLCSAVVLRVTVGLGTVVGVQTGWFDPVVSWSSWLVPLAIFEVCNIRSKQPRMPTPEE